jgi:DNA-binding response OmpR family regulator
MANQKIALVIDDDEGVVNSVKLILKEELNYLVLGATKPETAVDLANSYAFDLLILDLHMPKLDGFQVLELVRKKQPQVKVVVITGLHERYQDRFRHVKVDKIIEKPIDPPEFSKDIVAIAGSVDLPAVKPTDRIPKARILLVDDEVEMCEPFKECILENKPNHYEVEIAKDGKEGLLLNNEFEPDIIFFDIKMPHITGPEMVDQIKKGGGSKPKLFVALSADGYQNIVEGMEEWGCTVFTKPFNIDQVLKFIRGKCLELGLYTATNEEGAV